jgi:PspAA-like protein
MNRTKPVKKNARTKKSKKAVKKRPLRSIKKANKSNNKKVTSKLKISRAKTATEASTADSERVRKNKIVRIMGEGQFVVDDKTLNRLNKIDNSLVQLVSNDMLDNTEFKKRLVELVDIVEQSGKRLDPKRIIPSDIILPSVDLSIDEAKKLFKGDGVIPEI